MRLLELAIHRVRSIRSAELELSPSLNLITGPNGSGKSSCLESVYLLGLGRSFRSRSAQEVITFGEADLTVHGRVVSSTGEQYALGIERSRQRSRIRIAGKDISAASELARHLPILLITPDSQRLLTDGTRLRRRMLDWALFHVEPSYLALYQRYRQALRQRNAGLRDNSSQTPLRVWDTELQIAGEKLHAARALYVDDVKAELDRIVGSLLGQDISIEYFPGWDVSRPLAEILATKEHSDRKRGFTGHGPHRADLRFKAGGVAVQNVLSRGESKLFIAAVLLAQAAHVMERTDMTPVVMIDDLASELDLVNRQKLLGVIQKVQAQTLLTAVSGDVLTADWTDQKMFHVERGTLREVV